MKDISKSLRTPHSESETNRIWTLISPILRPLYCWRRSPPGHVLDNPESGFEVFKDLITRYDIDRGTADYHRLINIISSEIEDISAPARSTRFQAIRNFHRGMWIASWYSLILLTPAVFFENHRMLRDGLKVTGIKYHTPGIFSYWGVNWHFIVFFVLLVIGFHQLSTNFEIQFTEYLFSDYRASREKERDEAGWKTSRDT